MNIGIASEISDWIYENPGLGSEGFMITSVLKGF